MPRSPFSYARSFLFGLGGLVAGFGLVCHAPSLAVAQDLVPAPPPLVKPAAPALPEQAEDVPPDQTPTPPAATAQQAPSEPGPAAAEAAGTTADADLPGEGGAGSAAAPSGAAVGNGLPYFASIKAKVVNMRSGPGKRYPVRFTYTKQGLPLEVVARYDNWRQIRDPSGEVGWIHKNMLSGARTLITLQGEHLLFRDGEIGAEPIARIGGGVIGRLLVCPPESAFCQTNIGGFRGWLPRSGFWGLYPQETME